jgi:hypothetical protein
LTERSIRYARHGRNKNIISQLIRANEHDG